jgi:hypothetical protein
MSLYVRIFASYYTSRKTAHLQAIIGTDAFWVPPRMWAYAALNQPDGDMSKYPAQVLANLIGYTGDALRMHQALHEAGFLDPDGKIHDWGEHNGYHVSYAERAKLAAEARWAKRNKKGNGDDLNVPEASIPTGNASSIPSIEPPKEDGDKTPIAQKNFALPANEKEAVEWCAAAGVPPEFAKRIFTQCEATGYLDGAGRNITSFSRYVSHRWTLEQDRVGREKAQSQAKRKVGPNI